MSRLIVVPCELADANEFVRKWHRHHQPVIGHKFSVAVSDRGGVIHGVAITGRPVARHLDNGWTLEVTRVATDGEKDAPSQLYGACRRATFALGYTKLVTYTLQSEPGTSLRAAGWKVVGEVKGRSWDCETRPRVDKSEVQRQDKFRWEAEVKP